jgi:hypothetical protein
MLDLVVTFVYYLQTPEARRLTRLHLELLRRDNPRAEVVPLVYGCPAFIAGTVDAAELPGRVIDPADARAVWRHNDRIHLAYLWHLAPEARRYAMFEWDTCSLGMDLRTWYGDAWDADFASCHIRTPGQHPWWVWWPGTAGVAEPRGGYPFNGTLLSRRAVEALKAGIPLELDNAFCEARLASACQHLGLRLVDFPAREPDNGFNPRNLTPDTPPGVYHPVKSWSDRHQLELDRGLRVR